MVWLQLFRLSSPSARGSFFGWGPGGSRTTGAGDSPGESVSARAPLALVLAKGEDSSAAGLRPGDVGFGFSPRRDAPRMAGQSRKPYSRNPPPLQSDRLADAPMITPVGFVIGCASHGLDKFGDVT